MNHNVRYFITEEHPVLFPNLFKPRPDFNGTLQYDCTLLFDAEERKRILAECRRVYEAGKGTLADKQGNIPPFETLRSPIHESAIEKADKPAFASEPYYMACKSRYPVQIVDEAGNPLSDSSLFYSGVLCRLALVFKLYNVDGNCGISCYLQAVQRTGDGTRLTNGLDAASFFPRQSGSSGFNPFSGSDEELPF